MTPNATRVLSNWGDVLPEVWKRCSCSPTSKIHNAHGELLHVQKMIYENGGFPFCNTHRSYFQGAFYNFALSLGIPLHMNKRVMEYFEDDRKAGVIVDGIRHVADLVVGCDGVHSKCRGVVTGRNENPVSSGFAIFRAWLPLSALDNDPLLQPLRTGGDSLTAWIGPDVHCFLTVVEALDCAAYVVTHRDHYTVQESWSFPGKREDVLRNIEGWDPRLRAVVAATPSDKLIDWKLLWRDPVRQWVSSGGRIAVAGDAAHPFLPSSGNGASQAIEDATTIANALALAGKSDVPLALQAFMKLRYERVTLAQKNGFETRHRWHKTDWKAFARDPDSINLPQPDWLYAHDAEKYTKERWAEVKAHLRGETDTPFVNTNTYPGYVHEDWTVQSVMEMEKETAKTENSVVRVRARL